MPRSPYEVKAGTIIPTTLLTGHQQRSCPARSSARSARTSTTPSAATTCSSPRARGSLATYDSAVALRPGARARLLEPRHPTRRRLDLPRVHARRRPRRLLRLRRRGQPPLVANHHRRRARHAPLRHRRRAAGNVTGYQPTVAQLWAANAGGAVNQAGQQITQKNLAIQPTITVRAGYSRQRHRHEGHRLSRRTCTPVPAP